MWNPVVRLWAVRVILILGTLLYLRIGVRFMLDPAAPMARFGIELTRPESMTTIRTLVGALFMGMGTTAAYGLFVRRRTVACLWVLATFIFFAVAGRTLGVYLDGGTDLNLSELRGEATALALYIIALNIVPRPAKAE
ncbi:MAG: DUF4345 family protein [Rhodobacteraceae bacterium]|nr:DUF4345 family protein [Paracoccaceae bacterium]